MIVRIRNTVARIMVPALALLCMAAAGVVSGCGHVISSQILNQADQGPPFAELHRNPQAHIGKIVVLGGVVIQAHVTNDGTVLEMYQTRANHRGEPVDLDVSGGRFLAFSGELLDPAIYRQGRRVTLAGRVEGEKTGKIGDVAYHYPYLTALEIRLWQDIPQPSHEPCPWHLWDPWAPYDRWHYPFARPYYRPYSRW